MPRLLGLLISALILSATWVSTALAQTLTQQGSTTVSETATGLSEFVSTIYVKAPSWIAAIIVFALSFIFARVVKNSVLDRISEKFGVEDQDVLVLIGRATFASVLGLGITVSLSIAGIDMTAIVAAIGFGVGFAMQDLMLNFFAGIMILVNRQFTIGDFIKVGDTVGKVVEIQSRATILKAIDGTRVIVPNADLFTNQVTSFTSNPFRRIEIELGVDYRVDLAHAARVTMEAVRAHPQVLLDPPPVILYTSFGDSSIDYVARFWVQSRSNWLKIKSEVVQLINEYYNKFNVEMPYPIYTLNIDRDNDKIVIPTYRLDKTDLQQHESKREEEDVSLAKEIEASGVRAAQVQDIKPVAEEVLGGGPAGHEEDSATAFFYQQKAQDFSKAMEVGSSMGAPAPTAAPTAVPATTPTAGPQEMPSQPLSAAPAEPATEPPAEPAPQATTAPLAGASALPVATMTMESPTNGEVASTEGALTENISATPQPDQPESTPKPATVPIGDQEMGAAFLRAQT